MIEQFSGLCSSTMSSLLEIYSMQDWGMTWPQFIEQFAVEMRSEMDSWKDDDIEN